MLSPNHVQSTSTSTSAASSVRPRSKRLISGLSDADETELPNAPGPSPSSFDDRPLSPIPSAHPQRSTSRNADQKYAGGSWGRRAQVVTQRNGQAQAPNSPSFAGLWGTSWNTLQGIASEFLGNEDAEPRVKDNRSQPRSRPLPKWYRQMTSPSSMGGSAWGPLPSHTSAPAVTDIGKGTREERESAFRAQKRKDMLLRQDSSYADTLGKFKRRLSDDMDTHSAPPGANEERGALVYLHHVQKADTMAGITIKYNCSTNVLKKANRMWTNDTPQSRQIMVIPVGECGVKGKPLDGLTAVEAPRSSERKRDDDELSTPKASQINGTTMNRTRTNSQTSSSAATDSEPPWHHDAWVQLPGFSAPTEIARLSRQNLGYFPPARRKSISHSERNTPSTSLDLARVSTNDRQDSRSPQRPRGTKDLSNSNTGYFPAYLAGPGGVGTMNKNVRCPGPAQDGLNKVFAKHLPNVAPPKNQVDLYQPEIPLYTDDVPTPSTSGLSTPTGRNANMNIENVGGAIESWMRRMATKAMTPTEAQMRARAARASVGTPGKGAGGIGDLIEMTDEFEIGGDDEDDDYRGMAGEDAPRGRPSLATANATATAAQDRTGGVELSSTGADYFGPAAGAGRERRKSLSSSRAGGKGRKFD